MPNQSDMIDQGVAPGPAAPMLGNVAFIPPGLEGLFKDPFSINVIFNNIGAGATQILTAAIDNSAYFVCVRQMAEIWDAATGNTTNTDPALAPMLVKIQDTSSGKFQMDQATPLANIFGTGKNPWVYLYRAKLYTPGGQIQVELTNGMAAAQRVRLTFDGFRVYRFQDEFVTAH